MPDISQYRVSVVNCTDDMLTGDAFSRFLNQRHIAAEEWLPPPGFDQKNKNSPWPSSDSADLSEMVVVICHSADTQVDSNIDMAEQVAVDRARHEWAIDLGIRAAKAHKPVLFYGDEDKIDRYELRQQGIAFHPYSDLVSHIEDRPAMQIRQFAQAYTAPASHNSPVQVQAKTQEAASFAQRATEHVAATEMIDSKTGPISGDARNALLHILAVYPVRYDSARDRLEVPVKNVGQDSKIMNLCLKGLGAEPLAKIDEGRFKVDKAIGKAMLDLGINFPGSSSLTEVLQK